MKNLFITFLAASLFTACSKDNTPPPEPDKLPEATTVGANTAGCYINGRLIIPKNGINGISGSTSYGLEYTVGPNFGPPIFNEYFALDMANLKNQGLGYTIYIQLNNLLNANGIYTVGQSNGLYFSDGPDNPQIIVTEVQGTISTGKRFLSSSNSGIIKITRFDYTNKIISGTFSCNLYSNQSPNESIQVTEGRFDINLVTLNN